MNIAINGFGRIGRAVFRVIIERKTDLKVVAINDLTDTLTLAQLLKYDSCYGILDKPVAAKQGMLIVGNRKYKVLAEKNPRHLPWQGLGVDVVLECTGRFLDRASNLDHIKAGAKKVILSAPAKDEAIKTFVMGINEDKISKKDRYISNASCTTNCLAPVVDVIKENFGIEKAVMSTVHSYTADQNLVDGPHKDLRRARAAAVNIVPTTTGAAKAMGRTIPSVKGRFDGIALRVPTPVGSLCDVTFLTRKNTDEARVNAAFKKAARSGRLKGILAVSDAPLVSTDIIGNPASSIVDLPLTKVIGGNLVKVVAWYDNEWGYSNRMVDLAEYVMRKRLV